MPPSKFPQTSSKITKERFTQNTHHLVSAEVSQSFLYKSTQEVNFIPSYSSMKSSRKNPSVPSCPSSRGLILKKSLRESITLTRVWGPACGAKMWRRRHRLRVDLRPARSLSTRMRSCRFRQRLEDTRNRVLVLSMGSQGCWLIVMLVLFMFLNCRI